MIVCLFDQQVLKDPLTTPGGRWYYCGQLSEDFIVNGCLVTLNPGDELRVAEGLETHLVKIDFGGTNPGRYCFDYKVGNVDHPELCIRCATLCVDVIDNPVVTIQPSEDYFVCQTCGDVPIQTLSASVIRASNGQAYTPEELIMTWTEIGDGTVVGDQLQLDVIPPSDPNAPITTQYCFRAETIPDPSDPCNPEPLCADEECISITVSPDVCAGPEGFNDFICEGDVRVSLTDWLTENGVTISSHPDISVVWTDADGNVIPNPDNVLTGSLEAGDYAFIVTVGFTSDGEIVCSDTQEYLLTVVPSGDAGDNTLLRICNIRSVDLLTEHMLLSAAPVDAGGTWSYLGGPGAIGGITVGTDPIPGGDNPTIDFTGATPGEYSFEYLVGSTVGDLVCEGTAEFLIEVSALPVLTIDQDPVIGICRINGVIDTLSVTTSIDVFSSGSYAWFVDGVQIPGETGSTLSYVPVEAEGVHTLRVEHDAGLCGTVFAEIDFEIGPDFQIGEDQQIDCCNMP